MEEMKTVQLSRNELRILSSIREVQDSQLGELLEQFLLELTDFVREPRCPEFQADGVPCATPETDCEQCLKVQDLLSLLRSTLPKA